jgi:hypothetical protein
MSLVSCNVQNQLFQQGIMTVKVAYNMTDDVAKTANQRQIAAYSGLNGLPDLSAPLMVENVTNLKNSQLVDNGKGVIVPPDTYLAFQIAFGCQVGFGFGIEILPSSISIVDNNGLVMPRSSVAPSNQWSNATQYAFCANNNYNRDMIYVYDNNFGTHQLSQQIAANSYQIRITCTPLKSFTDSHNNTISVDRPNLDPPSNPPTLPGVTAAAAGDNGTNVHSGTVTGSGTSGETYGGCNGYTTADDLAVSLVFDVFVINQKYYNSQTYQFFQSNGGDGLND